MKTEYDISTKEKEISCLELVDDILYGKLGLKPSNGGTKYLRDLIIYIYKKNNYEFTVENELRQFIKEKNLKCNFKTVKSKIVYAINNAMQEKLKNNFYYIFKTDYDMYYLTIKNIVNATMRMLEKRAIIKREF